MRPAIRVLAAAFALAAAATPACAQSLAARVNAVRDGDVTFHYETRPGVCGYADSDGFSINDNFVVCGRSGGTHRECLQGPAFVTITRAAGRSAALHLRVGRAPAATSTDLGEVSPDSAVTFLVDAARTLDDDDDGGRALAAADVAESGLAGPRFLALAEAGAATSVELRKRALFWAGQSDVPFADIAAAYPRLRERELRRHFTFVVSQRREPEATDELIAIVRDDSDSQVRRQAIFWLGQRKDPRALQYLTDLVLR